MCTVLVLIVRRTTVGEPRSGPEPASGAARRFLAQNLAPKKNTPAPDHGRRGARAPGNRRRLRLSASGRVAMAAAGSDRRPSRDQCALAAAAPIPVSLRTVWASKPARSMRARSLWSVTENSQIDTKPIVMENSAGDA